MALAAIVFLGMAVLPAAGLYSPGSDGDVDPAPNPGFPQECGVDVLLVLDTSASLSAGNLTDVKNAANSTVDSLSGTDAISSVGVISFYQPISTADAANTEQAMTDVSTPSGVQAVKAAIGSLTLPDAETLTNWEAALLEASQSENDGDGDVPDENLNKPADIVIIVSDGRPNTYGYDDDAFPIFNNASTAFNEPLEAATMAANVVKGEGTKIIGVGFPDALGSTPPAAAFEAITNGSGSVAGSGDVQANDYYLVDDSSELEGVLTGIADQIACGLTVEKLNDANNDSTFSDDETATFPGDAVTYQVEVENTGSIDLTIDSYLDDVYGTPVVTPALVGQTLPAGDSIVVTFTGEAPPENGVKVNTFNVTASDDDGFTLSDEDDTTVRSPDLTPSIVVEKVNDANNDSTFSDDETSALPGDAVTYQVTITNDGPNNVTIDSYSDDIYGTPSLNTSLVGTVLAPGESVTVTFQGWTPTTEDTAKVNTFNVSGSDDDGDLTSDEDETTVRSPDLTPSIVVEKVNDANNDSTFSDDETSASPGDSVVYQVTVTNDGPNNVTIDSYSDDVYGMPTLNTSLVGVTLAPGESITVTFQGSTPTTEDTAKVNTFNVTAVDDDEDFVSDEDDTTVRSPDLTPSIVVEKVNDANNDSAFTDDETSAMPGDAVTYRVTVTNDGPNNVTIDSYSDDIYGSPTLNTTLIGTVLAPGESVTVTFQGSTPATEDTAKINTFNVTAVDDDEDLASDEDDTTVRSPDLTPSIAVDKLVDADGDGMFADTEEANTTNDAVTYRVTVTNDGPNNVTIDSYSDDIYGMPTLNTTLIGVELAPGDSIVVTFVGNASAEYDTAKTNVFTVNASDDDGDTATDNDDATVHTPPPPETRCARTPGFWMNHNGDYAVNWKGEPLDLTTSLMPITLGDGGGNSVLVDTDDVANAIFTASLTEDSHKSNGITKLYIHLLAAKFNLANGAIDPAEIEMVVDRADEILTSYDESDWDDIKKHDKDLAKEILDLKDMLDAYNNGAYDDENCIEDWWTTEDETAHLTATVLA